MYVVYVNDSFLDVYYLEQYFVCMLYMFLDVHYLEHILYVCCICKWLFLRCPLS